MQNTVIIVYAILAATVLAGVIIGAVRGLYRAIAGVLVLVLAIGGACWLTDLCAPGVEEAVRPAIENRIAQKVDEAVEAQQENPTGEKASKAFEAAEKLLGRFGWEGDLREMISEAASSTVSNVKQAVTKAVADGIVPSLVKTVLRIVFFLLLLLVLTLLSRLLRAVIEHLPILKQCNRLGGAVVGLVGGLLAAYVLAWALGKTGILPQESFQGLGFISALKDSLSR